MASEASTHLLVFSMERRLPPNSELVRAVLRLFQEPVPRAALRRHERLSPHSARARVTVEWLQVREDSSNRTSLVDSRWVLQTGRGGNGRGGGVEVAAWAGRVWEGRREEGREGREGKS